MKKQIMYSTLVLGCLVLMTVWASASELRVDDPWIREAPPQAKMLAGYMVIENSSNQTVALDRASSQDFRMVEIHRTTVKEGMAQMVKIPSLQIKAGETMVLEPGSYHLMLMKPIRSLLQGDTVDLQLHFDNGETIDVNAVVRKL